MTDLVGAPGGGWRSPVRQRLERGEPVIGVSITSTSLDMAALAASAGFDFLWVDMEHGPLTLETLRHIVLATRTSRGAFRLGAVVGDVARQACTRPDAVCRGHTAVADAAGPGSDRRPGCVLR